MKTISILSIFLLLTYNSYSRIVYDRNTKLRDGDTINYLYINGDLPKSNDSLRFTYDGDYVIVNKQYQDIKEDNVSKNENKSYLFIIFLCLLVLLVPYNSIKLLICVFIIYYLLS